jgi:hypothetical protein
MRELSEDSLIEDVERRMVDRYDDLTAAEVIAMVRQARSRFADSRVRDFVPLLVERHTRQRLDSTPRASSVPIEVR